jgi:hypothetical protein
MKIITSTIEAHREEFALIDLLRRSKQEISVIHV